MFSTDDTIVAIATPAGRGGIGVVRVSGPEAHPVACRMIGRRTPLEPRYATVAHVVDATEAGDRPNRPVDQVVVTYYQAPHSYTAQDVVEVSGHGSPALLGRIVELGLAAGARLAEPGEFTLRAYLNGRMDLVQAEAVADLVDAVTPLQARVAMDQLEGTLTAAIGRIEGQIFDLVARLEASLDFPDEGFHFITREAAERILEDIARDLATLIGEGEAGRVVREGSLVVIVGAPNAGKSSLFNALVGSARAIVTDVPGTTRDVISEKVDIGGLAVTLVDTAGLRDPADAIEAEGIRRAEQARLVAALTVLVIDGSVPVDPKAPNLAVTDGQGRRLIVASKSDCPANRTVPDGVLPTSSVTGAGLDELRRRIVRELTAREEWRDPPMVSNIRHLSLLREAAVAIHRATAAAGEGATEEVVVAELSAARVALEQITGRTTSDDLLHHIFSRFCVGK